VPGGDHLELAHRQTPLSSWEKKRVGQAARIKNVTAGPTKAASVFPTRIVLLAYAECHRLVPDFAYVDQAVRGGASVETRGRERILSRCVWSRGASLQREREEEWVQGKLESPFP